MISPLKDSVSFHTKAKEPGDADMVNMTIEAYGERVHLTWKLKNGSIKNPGVIDQEQADGAFLHRTIERLRLKAAEKAAETAHVD